MSKIRPLFETLDHGKISSEQLFGNPLYPIPTIFFSSFTIHAPTLLFWLARRINQKILIKRTFKKKE